MTLFKLFLNQLRLLDEVGLAEESPHLPLKVLHKELEARAFPRPAPLPTVQHSAATEMCPPPLQKKTTKTVDIGLERQQRSLRQKVRSLEEVSVMVGSEIKSYGKRSKDRLQASH